MAAMAAMEIATPAKDLAAEAGAEAFIRAEAWEEMHQERTLEATEQGSRSIFPVPFQANLEEAEEELFIPPQQEV